MLQSRLTPLLVALLALWPVAVRAQSVPTSGFAGHPPLISLHDLGRLTPLAGTTSPRLAQAQRVAPLPPSQTLGLGISLKVRDEAGLERVIHSIYTPGSPQYHHYLTPGQFAGRFAPPASERALVSQWLTGRGLHVTQQFRNGLVITARGSVAQVDRAFGTHLYTYRDAGGTFFANAAPVLAPKALQQDIAAVTGLTNALPLQLQGYHAHATAKDQPDPNSLFPQDLLKWYNIQPLRDAGANGEGQTIALFQLSDFRDQNLAAFDQAFNLQAPAIERIAVSDGNLRGADLSSHSSEGECELDIEVSHGIAPAARLLIYEGPHQPSSFVAIFAQIVSDDRAQVISTSYGQTEIHWKQYAPASDQLRYMNAMHQLFAEAAVQGEGVFGPAGDNGAYDQAEHPDDPNKMTLSVDYPASDPLVTAVGGTQVVDDGSGNPLEIPWADKQAKNPTGGGGGLSSVFKSYWYQTGPGVKSRYSNGMRQLPDVSAMAVGYASYSVDDSGIPGWQVMDGTSASTPMWAAYASLLNQRLGKPIGFLNPTLYLLGQKASGFQQQPFSDITQGDNLYYPATPGWDFATGWGAMNGLAMVNDITSMGGPSLTRPAFMYSGYPTLSAYPAGKTSGTKLAKVKAGQQFNLVIAYKMYSVANGSKVGREWTISSGSYTAFHTFSAETTIDKTDIGKTHRLYRTATIPSNAAPGAYTASVTMTVTTPDGNGWQVTATTQVQVVH